MASLESEVGLKHWGDWLALALYFCVTLSISIWATCRPARKSVKGYFLAGRNATWWPIGLSIFASNISTENFIGLSGSAASSGIALILFEWNAIFLILLMAWAFLPVYLVSGVYTLPEYLSKRFGGQRLRLMLAFLFLVSELLPSDMYTGGLFLQQALGWNIYAGAALIIAIACAYTIFGGLFSVLYTDAIQVVIMVAGAVVLSSIGLHKVGGFTELYYRYEDAVPASLLNATGSTCGRPREDAWHLFRHPTRADYPAPALVLRMTFGAVFYWCASQTIVQRSLAAKNVMHAKGAAVLAGFLKLTPFFTILLPGMISRVLFPEEVACADPAVCMEVCGSRSGCSSIAYPKLVMSILPIGLRGLMLAVMLSAVVSSMTSSFNSISTVFSMDIWLKARPRAREWELLLVGRIVVLVITFLGMAWIPVLRDAEGGQLFRYLSSIIGYLGAPLSATFLMAMFVPRANEQGAFWGFLTAVIPGLVKFGLDTHYKAPPCGFPDTRPAFLRLIHPYYFTVIQVFLGMIVCMLVSLCTEPIPKEKLAGLTFWSRFDHPEEEKKSSANGTVSPEGTTIEEGVTATSNELEEIGITEFGNRTAEEDEEEKLTVGQRLAEACCGWSPRAVRGGPPRDPFCVRRAKLHQTKTAALSLNVLAAILMAFVVFLYTFFH